MTARILMIEDEQGLVLSVGDRLTAEGCRFASAARGDEGLALALAQPWDLILIDVMLPGLDGFEIVRRLRQKGLLCPLVMVTARDQVIDRVSGLRLWADDYIPKPFAMDELVARIESHLRRQERLVPESSAPIPPASPGLIRAFGPFVLDTPRAGVFRDGERLALTHQEFRLLEVLMEHEGQVLGAEKLLNLAWGYGADVTSRTLYVHLSWLRQKLKTAERPDGFIQTVRGFGYLFSS